jgi:hypothetical protein
MILIIYILAVVGSFFAGLFINHYYPNYMKYKAKNLATKEDIGEITTIVESIKTDMAKDTEKLKAVLSLENQNKFSVKNEERKALMDYHNKYSIWHNLLSKVPPIESIEDFQSINQKFYNVETEYYAAASTVTLFFHDEEFVKLKLSLFKQTLFAAGIVDDYLIKRKYALVEYNLNKENVPVENQIKLYQEHINNLLSISKQFHKVFESNYVNLALADANMVKKIKSLIVIS